MAAQSTASDQSRDAAVNSLIEQLKHLPLPVPPSQEITITAAVANTHSAEAAAVDFVECSRVGDIALAPPQAPDEIGRLGGYRVLKMLGAGGMGMVYQAEDVQLQRPIALKVMKPEVSKNAGNRERFLREARAAAKLKSDHVVNIYQVGEEQQTVFLVMEFLEGMSLDDWLKKGRKPTLAQTARIGRQIALGLADAHACGLVHRDIKPGNIWLDSRHQGRVKLLDFGLARGDNEEVQLTQSGAIVGTPAYMAPEQARGEKVDPRCDLFSLGVVLYRLMTGQMPFRGDNTMSILTALAMDTPKPPREINPDIPPRMAALIESLLAKDREKRPATAKAVADELAAIEREATQPATEPTVQLVRTVGVSERPAQTAPSRSRLRWLAAASLLLLLSGVAAAIVVIIRDKQGKTIAEIEVPEGGDVHIQDKANKPPPQESVRIEPQPLAPLWADGALSPFALVHRPAKLAGVRSWSIVPREPAVVSTAAYRPDGKWLAVGSWDAYVHIWEAETGRLVQVLAEDAGISSLAWSPDGRVLAVGTGLSKLAVRLWDANSGRRLRKLESPVLDFIWALAWSPDGRKVRAWGDAGRLCTWEAAGGKLLNARPIACQWPMFSPDAQRFAGIVDGTHVVVWDAESGKEVNRLDAPAALWRLSWSPEGKRLACTGQDSLRVWDVASRKETFHYAKPVGDFEPPAWSPDGRSLAFTTEASTSVAVIDVASAAEPHRLENLGGAMSFWSPDGKTIACINSLPYVRLFDPANGKQLRSLVEGAPIQGFTWRPDGRTLAYADDSRIFVVSADTGQTVAEYKEATWPIAWSPDGKLLAAQGPDNGVLLRPADGKKGRILAGHEAKVASLAWSPDGKRLASTAVGEKRVRIWDTVKGEQARELGPFDGVAEKVKWSADGRRLTFNVTGVGWHVWDVEKNRPVNDPKQWKVYWFDLAPDGKSALVAPTVSEEYRLRDLDSGKEAARLPHTPTNEVLGRPAWTADGKMLAVTFYGGNELWRSDLRERLRSLKDTIGFANQVAFSRDGKFVAARQGACLYLWETATGRLRGIVLLGQQNKGLTLTPDGHYTCNEKVERSIVMVVQKDDGTQELLEPADFEQKYGFKNDPDKVHLQTTTRERCGSEKARPASCYTSLP